MTEYRDVSNKMIVSIALIGFVVLLVLWVFLGNLKSAGGQYDVKLESGWDVYVNGEMLYTNTDILSVNFGERKAGDVIDISTELSSELDGGYTIELLLYLCSVEAYLDDELIYSYGVKLIEEDVMVGSGYHFIYLPDKVAGKTLHLRMVLNEDKAFTSIAEPICSSSDYSYVTFARYQLISAFIGVFLFGMGFILLVISGIAVFYNKIYLRLLYIGAFSALMGMWTIMSAKVWQLYSTDRVLNSSLEYLSLFFAPLPFALLMYDMRKEDTSWRKGLVKTMSILLFLFSTGATILHFTNVIRYPRMLIFFHIVGFTGIIVIVFAGYITVKKKTNAETVTAVAMLMLLGVLAIDIGRFNLQKYVLPNFDILMNSFIPLGTLVFVILLLVSYLIYMYDMVMTKTEKDTLTKLAYHDVLTGLYNRAKYEQRMTELDASGEDFAIISIDLNDLKYVNDTFGHNRGDLMLTTFASILKRNFEGIGECFRTGGDEYIIIVDGNRINEITQAIVDMTEDEDRESRNLIFEIRASYGVAYRTEIDDGQAFKVFRLADRRMYEMKSDAKGKEYVFAKGAPK